MASNTPDRRRLTVIALLTGTFLASLDVTVVGTAMPRIVSELHGMELYGWVFSVYLLSSTVMVPIYGKLSDLIGRRPTYFIGIGIFLAGSTLCGLAPSMGTLIFARAVQGLGAGAIFPVTMILFGDLFTVEERAKVQGVFALTWGISSLIGPAVGGLFVSYWSWRWVFLINVPVGLGAMLLLGFSFHERIERKRPPIDVAGAGLVAAGLVALLAGVGRGAPSLPLLGGGLLLLGGLVPVERRALEPVVPPDLFRDPAFTIGCAANLFLGVVLFAYIAYVPLYLQGVCGLPPLVAGLMVAPVSFTWTLSSFIAGRWIIASGYRPVIRSGATCVALAASSTALAAGAGRLGLSPLAPYLAGQLFLGAGMGLTTSSLVIVVQDRFPWNRRGAATGVLQLARQIGGTLGVASLGTLLIRLLSSRLAAVEGAPRPEALVDPGQWQHLAPQVLGPARAALGLALGALSHWVLGLALLAALAAFLFPDVRAQKP